MQGSGGGIGRVESLVVHALKGAEGEGNLRCRWVRKGRSNLIFALQVVAMAVAQRPDLVVFTHVNQLPLALPLRVLCGRARQVVIAHGWDVWFGVPPWIGIPLRWMTAVWSVSEYTAGRLAATCRLPRDRIRVFPLGMAERPRPTSGRARTTHRAILTVARLDSRERMKGIDEVLQAVHRLQAHRPELIYTIVGEGDDRPRLERVVRELGLDDRVEFLGRVGDDELTSIYDSCDIFAMPSAQEGFGLVFLEAMAAGKPVIGALAGGIPEVVEHGRTGLLVDYGDVDGLALAIDRLAADGDLRSRLGRAGRARFISAFTEEAASARLLALVQEALDGCQRIGFQARKTKNDP